MFRTIGYVCTDSKLWIGFANPPTTDANLAIANREISEFATARITVVSV